VGEANVEVAYGEGESIPISTVQMPGKAILQRLVDKSFKINKSV
jgi:hypothetical protein